MNWNLIFSKETNLTNENWAIFTVHDLPWDLSNVPPNPSVPESPAHWCRNLAASEPSSLRLPSPPEGRSARVSSRASRWRSRCRASSQRRGRSDSLVPRPLSSCWPLSGHENALLDGGQMAKKLCVPRLRRMLDYIWFRTAQKRPPESQDNFKLRF